MVNNSNDTKEKILMTAKELFGKNGFDGVSVRDIAQAASVNVASINYHFNNKNTLFQEVFISSHTWLEDEIQNFVDQNPNINLKDLTWLTLNLFLENGALLLNTFRIFLSEQLDVPEEFHEKHHADGPPGSETFLGILNKEVSEQVSLDRKQWAIRTIFCHLFHMGMIVNTAYMGSKNRCSYQEWMEKDVLEKDTHEMVEAITFHLKTKYKV